VDYVSAADPDALEEVVMAGDAVLLSLAVFVGRTRLIDNLPVTAPHSSARTST
jgi:pantothenate synthetase